MKLSSIVWLVVAVAATLRACAVHKYIYAGLIAANYFCHYVSSRNYAVRLTQLYLHMYWIYACICTYIFVSKVSTIF